jgi:hypothetical protein
VQKQFKTGKYEAPAAGAFGGIATLGFGQHIPDTYPLLKSIIVYGSPAISLFYASVVQGGFVWLMATAKRREIEKALQRVRRIRDESLASKMSSRTHLNDLQKSVERTEKLASQVATASNVAVVEMFEGISISDLIGKATGTIQDGADGLSSYLGGAPEPQPGEDTKQEPLSADEVEPDEVEPDEAEPDEAETDEPGASQAVRSNHVNRATTAKSRNSAPKPPAMKSTVEKPAGKKPPKNKT